MKLTKRMMALALVGCMAISGLAACGKADDDIVGTETIEVSNANAGGANSVCYHDAIGEGVTLGQNDLIATIDGVNINESIYRAYLWSAQSAFEMQLGMDMGTMKDIEIEGGQTIGAIAKDNALKSVALAIVANNKADEMDIKLSDEEIALIAQDAKSFMDINGEIANLHEFGEQDIIDLLIGAELSNKVQIALSETYMPSEEDIATEVELAKPAYEKVTARHILLLTTDELGQPLSDEVKAEKLELANELLERVKNGEDIGKLAAEYSEDPGSKDNNGEYTFGRGEMVPEFETAAFDTADGEYWAEPVETSYGYHIGQTIAHQDADENQIKDEYIAFAKMDFAGKEMMSFIEEAKIDKTDAYSKIEIITNTAPEFELMPEEDQTANNESTEANSNSVESEVAQEELEPTEVAQKELETTEVAQEEKLEATEVAQKDSETTEVEQKELETTKVAQEEKLEATDVAQKELEATEIAQAEEMMATEVEQSEELATSEIVKPENNADHVELDESSLKIVQEEKDNDTVNQ
ncbi:hypothetical protein AN643_02665 [Candidatus Epulonipiscioides saccharophilum]|nr:hypothetical protein AN643_02665 [Epulopiscium sp. SCG-B10WGA-EpuloB]